MKDAIDKSMVTGAPALRKVKETPSGFSLLGTPTLLIEEIEKMKERNKKRPELINMPSNEYICREALEKEAKGKRIEERLRFYNIEKDAMKLL